jgi:hypothetical protein
MRKVRFLKRIKIAKGVSLNLSKKGAGLSAGPKGLKISRSAQGRVSGSMGIPGSGLSYRTRFNNVQGNEDEEINNDSFLANVADKSAYIAKHGTVLTKREMKQSLVYFLVFIFSYSFWFYNFLNSASSFNNLILLPIVVFLFLYIRTSARNKKLWKVRTEEHLKNCNH